MPITPAIEQWLEGVGYENHCFISYPRASARNHRLCPEDQDAIEETAQATDHTRNREVFLDDQRDQRGARLGEGYTWRSARA